MEDLEITTDFIKLDSALKFSGIAESGAFAKDFIKEGLVRVNGEVETRRGKKLYDGDVFSLGSESFKIKGTAE